MGDQCPTCGRCGEDWAQPREAGTKGRQRESTEDRSIAYRDWRWSLGNGLYVNDVDQVEWRMIDGAVVAVAVLELTRIDGNAHVPDSYLTKFLDRLTKRDPQGKVAAAVADRLNVCAYAVAWRWDLSEFWAYNLTREVGWKHWNQGEYRAWLASLKPRNAHD